MAKVAIVILNWNGQKMLAKYLSGVVEYSRQDAEVWVADNSSTDGSMHLLETQYPQVKTIVLEQNFGFAEGYNQALKQIEAEYYVLLNSDVEVTHHWLTPLIEFMDSHPKVAACQPKLLAEYDKDSFEYAGACGGFWTNMVILSAGGVSLRLWRGTTDSMITSRKCCGLQVPA